MKLALDKIKKAIPRKALFLLLLTTTSKVLQGQFEIVFESSSFHAIVKDSFQQGKIAAEVKLTCEIMEDPPHDCYTSIFFRDKKWPSLLYHGEVKAMVMSDINMDGLLECILFVENMGNWDSIEIFTLAKNKKTKKSLWYQPFESFLYYSRFEGEANCESRIFYNKKSNKIEIQTSRLTDQGIDCSEHIFPVWKVLNVR